MPSVGRYLFYVWGEMLVLLISGEVTEDVPLCRYQIF
jgi:hypothetical protein